MKDTHNFNKGGKNRFSTRVALRTSLAYILIASLWIILSDRFLKPYASANELYAYWQTIKGLLFVVVTGALLFFGLRAQLRKIRRVEVERVAIETHFSSLLAVSTDAIIGLDNEQRINYFNRGAEMIFGYKSDEVLGQFLDVLLPERFVALHREHIRQFAESSEDSIVMRSIAARRKDGEEFIAEGTATKHRDNDGMVFTAILRDINERETAEKTIRHHLARANALSETAARINANLDLRDVLDSICKELAKALDIEISLVALFDQQKQMINLAAVHGLSDENANVIKPVPVDKFIENIYALGPVAFLPKLSEVYDVFDEDLFKELGVHSVAVANMFEQDVFFGFLVALSTHETRKFTEDDTLLMKGLADQASLAIKNASLYSRAKQRLENLHALRAIDTAIASSLDLRLILQVLLEQAISRLAVESASAYLLNETTLMLEYRAGQGVDLSAFSRVDIRLGEGVVGKIALEQRTICIDDLSREASWIPRPVVMGEGLNVYCGAPMVAKGRTQGVLEVFSKEKKFDDPEWVELLETLAGQAAIAIETTRLFSDLRKANHELILTYDTTLEGWSRALDMRDKETEGHTQRVTQLTIKLAGMLGIKDEDLLHIRRGALLHDIGKLGVPDSVLLKEDSLNDDEWKIIKLHPLHAYNLLYPIAYLRPALEIPRSHHEHWDGNGYPDGLEGVQIPLAARIFAVVDVWDALTSDRPYREAWSQQKALRYIRERSGKQFDPSVVDAFLLLIEEGENPHLGLPD
jgi:PAS domain S-box-containing protein